MKNQKQIIEDLMKGCGKQWIKGAYRTECGNITLKGKLELCPICQAKLSTRISVLKECAKDEMETLERINSLISKTQYWKNEEDIVTEFVFEKISELQDLIKWLEEINEKRF